MKQKIKIELQEALAAFDGKHTDTLKTLAERCPASPDILQQLCDLMHSDEYKLQSAATWLLRRYQQAGADISDDQTATLCDVLLRDSYWEARLHVLQMMDDLFIPKGLVKKLWRTLGEGTRDGKKLIRAWSYHGVAALADQHPGYRDQALALMAEAERDEAASVRARIRRIRKALKWAQTAPGP